MNQKYINIGYVKDILTKKMINSINEDTNKNTEYITKFIDVISESDILKKEYDLFESLSNNKIPSEIVASRFLDKSLSIFENYTADEIDNEHSKLSIFIDESINIDNNKKQYYEDVSNLIYESLKTNPNTDTHLLFESFSNVLSYITNNNNKTNTKNSEILNENVLNIAINKFNNKYSNLNEEDIILFKKITNSSFEERKQIYEDLKEENLLILNKMLLDEQYENKNSINIAIQNINETNLTKDNIIDKIVKIYELNNGLKE